MGALLNSMIREGGLRTSDIAVLTPRAVDRSSAAGRCGNFHLTPTPKGPEDVLLSSIYKFKGLDAKAVVLCDVSEAEDRANYLALMYVGCSRARTMLAVLETA